MNKKLKVILTFIISFLCAFILVTYIKGTFSVQPHWIAGVTEWDKFSYYIAPCSINALTALVIALIFTITMYILHKSKSY